MAPHDQGLSAASPLGKNEEAESMLPFNLSSLATESLSATVFQSHLTLNMEDIDGSQLCLSNSRNESLQGDYSSLLCQEDLPGRDNSYAGMATNDDMNWLLLGLSTRLDNLETAVANGNARIAHLDAQIIGLTDEFQRAIAHLKKGVKELATAFLASGSGDSKTQT